MKNILVPIDFSTVSESAADYAAELAKSTSAKVILYHVYTLPLPSVDMLVLVTSLDGIEKANMDLLHKLDKKIKTKHGNITTQLLCQPGFVVDEVSSFTKKNKIDLVVMGVNGAGENPWLLDSRATSISVIHHSETPLIIVPEGYKFKKPSVIALAYDYKTSIPDEAITKFKSFIRLFNSQVIVFNVIKTGELATYQKADTEVKLENALSDIAHSLYFPTSDNLPQEINQFVDKHKVDILTMFPHNYNFFKGMLHHSATKEMAFLSNVPLLSIHA